MVAFHHPSKPTTSGLVVTQSISNGRSTESCTLTSSFGDCYAAITLYSYLKLAHPVGIEPTTGRLTICCTTIVLQVNIQADF